MQTILIGGGIGGLTAALWLHKVGVPCRIFEASPAFRPLGVGISLQPHAMTELAEVGLAPALMSRGVVAKEKAFFTASGSLIHSEPYDTAQLADPYVTIQRSDLHDILLGEVIRRLGPDAVVMDRRCVRVEQSGDFVTVHFVDSNGSAKAERADIAVGCDGLHSAVRRQMYPNESAPIYSGVTSWRGLVRSSPFLSGSSIALVGAFDTALFMAYPVRQHADGGQLLNLIASVPKPVPIEIDGSGTPGRREDFIEHFREWTFDWLDVPGLLYGTDSYLELPLVDRDPLARWTFDRVTLLGDAAHPMSPRGGNGAAQSIIDAAELARSLANEPDIRSALERYEAKRRPAANTVVMANRESPPDLIIKRAGDGPAVDSAEFKNIWANYNRLTGAARD